jgi:hypothetical protein
METTVSVPSRQIGTLNNLVENFWLRAWGGATFNDKTTNLLDAMLNSIHKSSRPRTETRYTVPPDLQRDLDSLGYARLYDPQGVMYARELYALPEFKVWDRYRESLTTYAKTMKTSIFV